MVNKERSIEDQTIYNFDLTLLSGFDQTLCIFVL